MGIRLLSWRMAWLRFITLTVLLLRIAAGSSWAMPMVTATLPASGHAVTVSAMPCHMTAAPVQADADSAHTATPAASVHCALCFSALSAPITVFGTALAHSHPRTTGPFASPWQPLPELRPPI